jgi:RNA polymerase sigma-70 factor (ECF subfamily)
MIVSVQTTLDLLMRAREGDAAALDALLARYVPRLRQWASRRLPPGARQCVDTDDLVQESLMRAFTKVRGFDIRGEGALLAYLRQVVLNRIRDEIRSAGRRPAPVQIDSDHQDVAASPLEHLIGNEALERYERALASLRSDDREAIIARVELGYSNEEIAEMLGKRTANAARMTVERALIRLAERMQEAGKS